MSQTSSPEVSIVTPVYRSEGCILELYGRLRAMLESESLDYEIVMVDDGSPDASWVLIKELAAKDPRIKGVAFTRNFGQHLALTAGLDAAAGDWVVIMDSDLQDAPEEIPRLLERAKEGFDIVLARRVRRRHGAIRRLFSAAFYRVFNFLTDTATDPSVGTFRVMSRTAVDAFVSVREQSRFFGGIVQWLGFPTAFVDVEHAERYDGRSTYTFRRMLSLATTAILAFSYKPLQISVGLGVTMSALSIVAALVFTYRKFVLDVSLEGWTSVIVTLFFLGGVILMNQGILGVYLGRVFAETKGRPLYVVRERLNLDE